MSGSSRETPGTLQLSPEEMRALGYRVIDLLVEHFTALPAKPVTRKESRQTLQGLLWEDLPEEGTDSLAVLARLERDVFANMMHVDHPRFFAFVPGPSNFVGAMADALASGFNVFAGTWLEGSGPAQVELVAVDWLRQACGLPPSAGGLFVSGGSVANITALAVARHVRLGDRPEDAVVYCSDQTHSSIARGLWLLGFRQEQLHQVRSDEQFRIDVQALRRAIVGDRRDGKRPFCLVANAGTTNTGAVDPLRELASICEEEGLWLHVDGAYGAAAVLCERGRAALAGLGRVDSLSLDPHKWLFQPYEIGCVLVRQVDWLRETFHVLPEYLTDAQGAAGEVNFSDRGIQLTRGFRALKLWLSLMVFGASGFRQALDRGFDLAELAEEALQTLPDWEVVTPAQMGVITLRCAPAGLTPGEQDGLNRRIVKDVVASGFAMISTTVLQGRVVLRLCTINPRTSEADIRKTIARLASLGRQGPAS